MLVLKWIGTLPLFWQISLPITFMVFITVIALYGKLWLSFGKNKIGIGRDRNKKRSCMDCSMFHRAEAAKVNRKILQIETNITKKKMTYAEQKLLELRRTIYNKLSHKLKELDYTTVQLRDLSGRLKLVMNNSIKDEIRRSIKENGFHTREGSKFNEYVEDQTGTILDMFEEDFMEYYDNDLIVNIITNIKMEVTESIYSIYENAKVVEFESKFKIRTLERQYDSRIDEFIGVKDA